MMHGHTNIKYFVIDLSLSLQPQLSDSIFLINCQHFDFETKSVTIKKKKTLVLIKENTES